jgi:hypothetical protein
MSEEVRSIPAGDTGNLIHKWHLYVCPASYKPRFNGYELLCFRHLINNIKGATNKIYKIKKIVPFDISNGKTISANLEELGITEKTERANIRSYFSQYGQADEGLKNTLDSEPHLLVFLQPDIDLPNLPRPETNGTYWTSFSKNELKSSTILQAKQPRGT